ncbi:MAG: glycoside hydrolase family 3 C-terminal domain-containing protein [Dysgonamonadaceae bacterium]|jgi:beta-glucosidase|nr:glycoside hydrolase family 3 C-terminal domain-containing protein [Dysgonamonadaceae bacterium]
MKIRKRPYLSISLVCFVFIFSSCNEKTPDYLNTRLSFEVRADDLLSRMTLEEKVQFMRYDSPAIDSLGIPAYNWWNECLHGVARSGLATVFPQAIGMAAMWDTQQMFEIGDVISDEARAKYHKYASEGKRGIYHGLTFWTPNINIFRDPRWGRGMETYGEDPYLAAELAIPFIKGMQGDDPKYLKLVATVKHFAVHSGPEPIRHQFDVLPSDYDMAETYLPHFMRCVKEADVYSVMCAYQRLRGEPCCGNKYLEDLLRNKWGFEGYIVSDCWAINDFYNERFHHIVNTRAEAAAMAVKAGTDLNCGASYDPGLLEAVKENLITESEIDVSVRRLIVARMKLGQFDPDKNQKYAQIPISVLDNEKHRLAALISARKSMVLLKNDNRILPFSKEVKKVAVIGPNADDASVLLGNYNGFPSHPVTPLQGIKEKLPQTEVVFAQGCRLAKELPCLTTIPAEYFFTDESKKTGGLNAEYYDNGDFQGEPKHKQVDANINFRWWDTAPFNDLDAQHFSVRWKGVLAPAVSGEYAIGIEASSGFELKLDGKLILRGKNEHSPENRYEFVSLDAGKVYEIEVDYVQDQSEYAIARMTWDAPNPNLKKEAVALAKTSDLVVLCMGLSPMLEGEEMPVRVEGFKGGDRIHIGLPDSQTELIRTIHKLGKPTVLVLLNGSALAINWEAENLPAILDAWYPGQAGGTAIADVLFGDYNPAGRLPVTFYKGIDQLPDFENYDMANRTYRYFSGIPLYEFGYGLSYTDFEYTLKNFPSSVNAGDSIRVSADVSNIGAMDGDEVVQLYVSLPDSKLRKPIRSLQGFKRIHLKKGETQTVEFVLQPKQFAARDSENVPVVEAGNVQISIGGKQPDAQSIAAKRVVTATIDVKGDHYFVQE